MGEDYQEQLDDFKRKMHTHLTERPEHAKESQEEVEKPDQPRRDAEEPESPLNDRA